MSERETKPTNCCFCGYLCGLTATVEDGRVVDLAPDPSRYPYDERIVRGCPRWSMNLRELDDPARVNWPLHRIGGRGSGRWQRVSWDEALDDIASRLRALIDEHGPATLASAIGGPHASYWPLHRFMSLVGSPNNMGIGQICWNPRIWMEVVTFGWTVEPDIDPERTGALVLWGTNPAQSDNSAFWRAIIALSKSDVPLVVIDPRRTQTAARADLWLPLKPGTDCALACGLLHVIIAEGLYDATFVDAWCHGFDELRRAVRPYDPQTTASICGVSAEDIETAARIFARAGAAALVSGRGIDQIGANVAPAHRAICCLRAITGNVDKRGACVLTEASDFAPEAELEMSDRLSDEARAACLNAPHMPLQSPRGHAAADALARRLGRALPYRYLTSAHPDLVLKAMLTGEPYPVRVLVVEATNPLLTYADTRRVHEALSSLDLLVVLEHKLTPTAALADYVLPAAGALERPTLQAHGGVANIAYGGPAAVHPYHERKTDYDIIRALGLRLGQAPEDWPDETLEDAFARILARAGMSWNDYCERGLYAPPPAFAKHERIGQDGTSAGFATSTGKIELASELLDSLGGPRVPAPAPVASLAEDELSLITGARMQPYNASMFFDNAAFRARHPEPTAEVSPLTAARLGLADGDGVAVSTATGEARFTLAVAPMRDGVVSVEYGWWYPEEPLCAPDFAGIGRSNANLLTSCAIEGGEALIGTWSYNAIPCRLRKIDPNPTPNKEAS